MSLAFSRVPANLPPTRFAPLWVRGSQAQKKLSGRCKLSNSAMSRKRIEPGPGQESVWDYPRPPACQPSEDHVQVYLGDEVLADSKQTYRVLETSHPPVYYIPQADVKMDKLRKTSGNSTYCEWKGSATYFNAVSGPQSIAWAYEFPTQRFGAIKDYLAFYPSKVKFFVFVFDQCCPAKSLPCREVQKALVNGERVEAQEGDFYGGWKTSKIVGPFKGGFGTWGW